MSRLAFPPFEEVPSVSLFQPIVNYLGERVSLMIPMTKLADGEFSCIPNKNFINSNQDSYKGIDIPLLITPPFLEQQDEVVIILGQDPLRSEKETRLVPDFDTSKVIVGTPYAVHLLKMFDRNYPKGFTYLPFYKSLIEGIFELGKDVYLTDCSKIYDSKIGFQNLWNNKNFRQASEKLLEEELNNIKGQYRSTTILLLGDAAKKTWNGLDIDKSGIKIAVSPHPAAFAQTWIKFSGYNYQDAIYLHKIQFIQSQIQNAK